MINKKVTTEKFYSPFVIEDQIKLFVYQSNEDVNSKEFIVSNYKIIKNLSENLNKVKICKCTFPSSNEVDTLTIKSTKLLVRSHSFIWSSHSASYLSAICDWSALSTNQNAVFAGCRARAREDPPRAGRTTGDACIDVTRLCDMYTTV